MKYVQWCEPFHGGQNPPNLICRLTVEDAIRVARGVAQSHGCEYETDQQALDDFLVVYWAEVIEVEEKSNE